ncbi:MAG: aspartate aminotransferase family protein [Marinobacter sp.]|uniref:pyridoxal phosphate-dependent decarboxylase family protein n=1 Tax=Marinobacter sp. TaxID=50741 RepID=UPI00299E739A|nr:aspartate aminotransferase family protein [Marinobacter sp.]MDX1755926.1 aspartate aminotransferase family protein [Marinobacter sp.]
MSDEAANLTAACSFAPATATSHPDLSRALFNDRNLTQYRESLSQAIDRVEQRLASVEGPFTGVSPGELSDRFAGLDLEQPCQDLDQALTELEALYLQDAVYFHHPRYVAHLNCPVAIPAIAAEVIQASINTSVDTWDQSAGATLIEQSLIDWTAGRIGLGPDADGVFTSGGTQSNLMAMLLARDNVCQRLWQHCTRERGLHPEAHKLRIFCSEVSHFSVQKAAALLGLGYDAVVPVPCDRYFRMDVNALEQALQHCRDQGRIAMAVVATAGTTDFGSIDPLPAIADLCEAQGLWLHADAAYGCGLLTSTRHRHLLRGIERADSVTVDYHKSFLQPVACSALLARDKRSLACVTWHAEYLNPLSAREQGTPNLVDKSLQTTRRFDALKLWLTLRTLGAEGLGEAFDTVIHLARKAYLLLLSDDAIEVIHQPQLSTLVFRFRPDTGLSDAQLDAANRHIRQTIMASGEAMIAATKVDDRQYLKFTLLNPQTRIQDLQAVLRLIKRHGADYLAARAPSTRSVQTRAEELSCD